MKAGQGLEQTTPPTARPLTCSQLKAHLRVDGSEEDALVDALLAAATGYVERFTRRQLVTASYRWTLPEFPETFLVPRPPLRSVTAIEYVDTAGTTQTLSADAYTVLTGALPGRIHPAWSESWPSARSVPEAVTVTYQAGFGAAADVPEMLKTAIRLLAGHWFEHREAATEERIEALPLAVQNILWFYRVPGA
ncbi:MAG: head-tail connector protein [Phycisphaerae bacterium]